LVSTFEIAGCSAGVSYFFITDSSFPMIFSTFFSISLGFSCDFGFFSASFCSFLDDTGSGFLTNSFCYAVFAAVGSDFFNSTFLIYASTDFSFLSAFFFGASGAF
jgi:hypothetical protein